MTDLNPTVELVTQRIIERSRHTRDNYVQQMEAAISAGVQRAKLSCGNMAHACAAASDTEKQHYLDEYSPNIGIVTAYNDMLSAHQPFEHYPALIKQAALSIGATAQVAGGVPAMCDGVTQGQSGMELSLFSRDVIAMAAAVSLSHQCFDAAVLLGVCDKIIPGLTIAAASFGHLPIMMIPAGPMPSGISNEEKSTVRQQYASGEADKTALLAVEMGSYHSAGTCTFYGTANTNQLIMEIMGLHLPGASFVNPNTQLREALTHYSIERIVATTFNKPDFTPAYRILSEKNFVNGIVGLLASGGSTNLVIHLIAMARAAGIIIDLQDFADLSAAVPLISKVYPNGLADINGFQAAGGMPVFISELLKGGFLHKEVTTIIGNSLNDYLSTPILNAQQQLEWQQQELSSSAYEILAPLKQPHAATGGLMLLEGNLGRAIIKVSALKEEQLYIRAACRIFHSQEAVKAAFEADELNRDVVCVVRFQGPQANGMPELHGLTPILSSIQARGYKVALVTDGRMSGASGRVPAAIHVSPEACSNGSIARLKDGDIISLDANNGTLTAEVVDLSQRQTAQTDLSVNTIGCGRELFGLFRQHAGSADSGASVFFPDDGSTSKTPEQNKL